MHRVNGFIGDRRRLRVEAGGVRVALGLASQLSAYYLRSLNLAFL